MDHVGRGPQILAGGMRRGDQGLRALRCLRQRPRDLGPSQEDPGGYLPATGGALQGHALRDEEPVRRAEVATALQEDAAEAHPQDAGDGGMQGAQPELAAGGRHEVQGHQAQGEDGATQGTGECDAGSARQRLSRPKHSGKAKGHDGKDALPKHGPRPDLRCRCDIAESDGGAQDDAERGHQRHRWCRHRRGAERSREPAPDHVLPHRRWYSRTRRMRWFVPSSRGMLSRSQMRASVCSIAPGVTPRSLAI